MTTVKPEDLPYPFPCGGHGEPACPPQPADDPQRNALAVVEWYEGLAPEHRAGIRALIGLGAPADPAAPTGPADPAVPSVAS